MGAWSKEVGSFGKGQKKKGQLPYKNQFLRIYSDLLM